MFHNDYITPITLPKEKKPILIHKGKLFYSLKRICFITKDELLLKRDKTVRNFYFLTKFSDFQQTAYYPEAKSSDILIDSIQSLLSKIINSCSFKSENEYKINLFTDRMNIIDSNSALLDYKGNMMYAKIIEFQEKAQQEFVTMNKCDLNSYKRLYPFIDCSHDNDDKSNRDSNGNGNSNSNSNSSSNNSSNVSAKQFSYKNNHYNEQNTNNNNNNSAEKLHLLALSRSNINPNIKSKISQKFYPIKEERNINKHILRPCSEILFQKYFKVSNSNKSFIRKIDKKLVLPSNKFPACYFSYQKKNNMNGICSSLYDNNNSKQFNIHRSVSSSLLSLSEVPSSKPITNGLLNKTKYIFKPNLYPIDSTHSTISIAHQSNSSNHQSQCHSQSQSQNNFQFNNQFRKIRHFFQTKQLQSFKKSNPLNNKSCSFSAYEKIKCEYISLISESRDYIINHLNKTFKGITIPSKLLLPSNTFENLYPSFPYIQCRKEFIFYSYLNYNFDKLYPGLLIELTKKHPKKLSDIIHWIIELRQIIKDVIDNPQNLFDYINAKIIEGKIIMSSMFFQIFVLCYDYFDKIQASLSNTIMMIFGIYKDLEFTFESFVVYYLHFKQGNMMTKEQQFLFLKKIINMIIKEHQIKINKEANDNNNDNGDNYNNGFDYEDNADNEFGCQVNEGKSEENDKESKRNNQNQNQSVIIDNNDLDIYESFRFMFNINDLILNFILEPCNDVQWTMMMKRKQSKIDEIYEKIIIYFNHKINST